MMEFGLLPSFVTTRQMSVLLRACHSRLIAPETSLALCIFAHPCGRPGCLAQTLIKPNFRSNWGSFMILWRNDSRPFAMTWITVCIHEKIQQEITPFAMFVWIESVDPCNATHACLTEARLQLIFKQRAVHDVNIDESFFRMPKCARQGADNF